MAKELGKSLVDSCVLIYLVDKCELEKHERAVKWFEEKSKTKLYVTNQIIREFAWVCSRKSKLSAKEVIDYIDLFTARFLVLNDDFLDIKNAITLSTNNPNLFWDANIVSVMLRNNLDYIYTENTKDFQKLGIRSINPFE